MNSFLHPGICSGPKRSLVLAGGGMRVSYQAGVLMALAQQGLSFNHIDGTSSGTLNVAMLLSGLSPAEIVKRWELLNVSDFVSFMPFKEYIKLNFMPAWGDVDSIVENVFPRLGIDLKKIRECRDIKGTFNVCNYTNKLNEVILNGELTQELLVASISLPIFMPAVEYKKQLYTDSIWIKGANLKHAVQQGAEEIWLVWCIGNHEVYNDGAFDQFIHMMEVSANGSLNEELAWIEEVNEQIDSGISLYGQRKPVRLHVIKPDTSLPSDFDLYRGKVSNKTLIDTGYADAMALLRMPLAIGHKLDFTATKMRQVLPGLIYRESYKGGLKLIESNLQHEFAPILNYVELAMTIHIEDAKSFMAGVKQRGRVTGRVLFQGEAFYIENGSFICSPTFNDTKGKQLKYHFLFNYQGQDFIVEGGKSLKVDPGSDGWSDIINLSITLFQKTEHEKKQIAIGVLRQGVTEVAELVASFHPVHIESETQGTTLVSRFGKYLLGQYYQLYLKPDKKWWKVW